VDLSKDWKTIVKARVIQMRRMEMSCPWLRYVATVAGRVERGAASVMKRMTWTMIQMTSSSRHALAQQKHNAPWLLRGKPSNLTSPTTIEVSTALATKMAK
jgi:hypothetical protein